MPTRAQANGAERSGDDAGPTAIPELPVDAHPGAVPRQHPRDRRLLRGRVVQGHRLGGAGGLRLDRAGQALHHGHDGPDPGQDRAGQRHRGRGRGHRPEHRRNRDDDLAAALRPGDARGAGRAAPRAGSVLTDAAVARGARRPPAGRRGLDPARSLRRPGRRGPERAEQGRHHRRHPDRQARPARSRRAAAAQPGVRQQVVQARPRPGPVRRDVRRGRRGPRRRRHRPAGRGPLPDEHHVLGGRGGVGVGGERGCRPCTRTGRCTSPR